MHNSEHRERHGDKESDDECERAEDIEESEREAQAEEFPPIALRDAVAFFDRFDRHMVLINNEILSEHKVQACDKRPNTAECKKHNRDWPHIRKVPRTGV